MTDRTVTGTILYPDGSPWASGIVHFSLMEPFSTSIEVFPAKDHTETLDAQGKFTIDLAVPDTGTAHYKIATPDGSSYDVYIASGAATDLQTLLTLASSPVSQTAAQTVIDAHTAAADPHVLYALETMPATQHFGWSAGNGETAIDMVSNSGALQVNKEIRIAAATGVNGCFGARNTDANAMVFACEDTADATNRFRIMQHGDIYWGDGTAAPDIVMLRDSTAHLSIQNIGTNYKTLKITTNQFGAYLQGDGTVSFTAASGFNIAGDYQYMHVYNGADDAILLSSFSMSYIMYGLGIGTTTDGMTAGGSLAIAQDLAHRGSKAGFYNTAPISKPTGVAVSAAGIHGALVSLGLIAA
jgi:hypothetical protein